jgi:hypothetical protein
VQQHDEEAHKNEGSANAKPRQSSRRVGLVIQNQNESDEEELDFSNHGPKAAGAAGAAHRSSNNATANASTRQSSRFSKNEGRQGKEVGARAHPGKLVIPDPSDVANIWRGMVPQVSLMCPFSFFSCTLSCT